MNTFNFKPTEVCFPWGKSSWVMWNEFLSDRTGRPDRRLSSNTSERFEWSPISRLTRRLNRADRYEDNAGDVRVQVQHDWHAQATWSLEMKFARWVGKYRLSDIVCLFQRSKNIHVPCYLTSLVISFHIERESGSKFSLLSTFYIRKQVSFC